MQTVITWLSLKSRNACVYEYHNIKIAVIYAFYIVVYILTQNYVWDGMPKRAPL